jgi:hypothetical protein
MKDCFRRTETIKAPHALYSHVHSTYNANLIFLGLNIIIIYFIITIIII